MMFSNQLACLLPLLAISRVWSWPPKQPIGARFSGTRGGYGFLLPLVGFHHGTCYSVMRVHSPSAVSFAVSTAIRCVSLGCSISKFRRCVPFLSQLAFNLGKPLMLHRLASVATFPRLFRIVYPGFSVRYYNLFLFICRYCNLI